MMTGNMMKNMICWPLVIICVMMFSAPEVLSAPAAQGQENSRGAIWEKWQPLAEGFMARRRIPEGLNLAKELRQPSSTQLHELKLPGAKGKDRLKPGKASAVWIYTGSEGLYSMTLTDLATVTGSDVKKLRNAAKQGRLRFLNAEDPVSWYYDAANKRILFTGEEYETFYTKGNAYLMQQVKKSDPEQMIEISKQKRVLPAGTQTPFRDVLEFEEEGDMMAFLWLYPLNPDARYWFWGYLYPPSLPKIDIPLYIPNPADNGKVKIQVQLHGWTDLYDGNDHQVYAELNGHEVGSIKSWDGLNPAELIVDVDQALLSADGNNLLVINSLQGGQFIESVSVAYNRMPVAENDQLWMRNVSAGIQEVIGFSSPDILVIESPVRNSVLRNDSDIYQDESGTWALSFEAAEGKDYLIIEISALHSPALDGRDQADLTARENAADYMIIAAREFSGTAQALGDYRAGSYDKVRIVWLDDIYKSFSAGRQDPFAIGRFMNYVQTEWSKVPSSVILVGKGSLDRKDCMGYGDNFLPILMASTPWSLAPSDTRLLGVEDGVPPFSIGRLPITNDDEGLCYVDKLIVHESLVDTKSIYQAVVVADNPDDGGDFYVDADRLASELLGNGFESVIQFYHPTHSVRSSLIKPETWSSDFISYSGHGSWTGLGNYRENFILATDAMMLNNTTYCIFAALTCSAGFDAMPGTRSLAGALVLNPQGGAIASMAPSGLSSNDGAHILGSAFIDNLYGGNSTVGDALAEAKQQAMGRIDGFMMSIYSIIGDPLTHAR